MPNSDCGCRTVPERSFADDLTAARGGSAKAAAKLVGYHLDFLRHHADAKLPQGINAKVAPSDVVVEVWFKASNDLEQFRGHSE